MSTRSLAIIAAVLGFVLTAQNVRPVQAEDDCRMGTTIVERLPIIGLVCIGE